MKNLLLALMLLSPLVAFAAPPPPILRQALTTNTATGTFTNGQVPTWNGTTWAPGNGGSGIPQLNGAGTNTTITNFFVHGAFKRPGTQLVHFAAVDLQLTRTETNQVASGYGSFLGPGTLRSSARAIYSMVWNGFDNHVLATGERSIIGGGQENTNGAPFSVIFGVGNYTSSNSAGNLFVTGSHNRAEEDATDSGIISGSDNQIAGISTDVFILSSYISRIVDSSVTAIIAAESGYITNGPYATIVGGIGHKNFNSSGSFIGGGTSITHSNASGSFSLGASAMVTAGNAGTIGVNLTNDIAASVDIGEGSLGNKLKVDQTNAWLVGSLKLKQTNANAVAIEAAGSILAQTFTGVGSEPGFLLLQNSNQIGAVQFIHSGPSSASNVFNFSGITNPVAGQVLKVHSVSGNVVTLTNDAAGGGNGYTLTGHSYFNSPAESTTYYAGRLYVRNFQSAYANVRIPVPKTGTVKRVDVCVTVMGVGGTGEDVQHFIRLNDTTDFGQVDLDYTGTPACGSATTTQAVIGGTDFVALKIVTPTWVTDPTEAEIYFSLYIE